MSRSTYLRPVAAVVGVVAVAALSVTTLAVGQASATPLPWQSGSLVDPNEKGTLALYDAQGVAVTSGSTDTPLAAYAVGSAPLRSGDDHGQLSLYTVSDAQVPLDAPIAPSSSKIQAPAAGWTGQAITAAAVFPVAGSPTLPAGPVGTFGTGSTTLAQHIAAYPNSSTTAGYKDVYELRLSTTKPGQPFSPAYDAVDILVTGTTWKVIDQIPETTPPPPTPTSTTLSRSATSVQYGYRVTFTAQVTSAVAGSVSFYDGTSLLGSVAVNSAKAAISPVLRGLGTHSFKAVFTPTSATYAASTSAIVPVSVVNANPTLTVGWPVFHSYATNYIAVRVTSPYITPAGYIAVYDGTTRIALGTLNSAGAIKIATPRRARGWHTIKVAYLGKSPLNARYVLKKVYFN